MVAGFEKPGDWDKKNDNFTISAVENQLLNNISAGVAVFKYKDGIYNVIYGNNAFLKMIGKKEFTPLSQALTLKSFQVIHPLDLKIATDALLKMQQGVREQTVLLRFTNKERTAYNWMKVTGKVQELSDAKLIHITCVDVSDEKRQDEKIQLTFHNMQSALEEADIYSGRYDVVNKMFFCNRKLQRDFGLPARMLFDLVEDTDFIISRDGKNTVKNVLENLINGDRDTLTREAEFRGKTEGEWLWVRFTYSVVDRDDANRARLIMLTGQNVTRRKMVESRFDEDTVYQKMLLKDMASVVRINISKWQLIDYAGEYSFLYREGRDLIEPIEAGVVEERDRARVHRMFSRDNIIRKFMSGITSLTVTYLNHRLTGRNVWVETTIDILRRADDDIVGLLTVKDVDREITSEKVQNTVIDSMVDFLAYKNYSSMDVRVYSQYPEYQVDEADDVEQLKILLNRIHQRVVPEDKEDFFKYQDDEYTYKRVTERKILNYEYRYISDDGTILVKNLTFIYMDPKLDVIIIMQRDITDIVEEEEIKNAELQSALTIANSSAKVQTEFLSTISHDLRTPLNGILGAATLAAEYMNTNPDGVNECIQDIKTSGNYMLELVNDILDHNRIREGKMELHNETIDWQLFKNHITNTFLSMCNEKDIGFEFKTQENMTAISSDPVQLNRIFSNLITNAIKFTDAGGKITCEVRTIGEMGDTCPVEIKISDNGIGMSEEFQEHMYDAFTQEKRKYSMMHVGTGLGLPIVKNLVDLMGGTMQCESRTGVGTTFIIRIPFDVAAGEIKSKEIIRYEIDEAFLKNRRIILAEDHEINAKIAIHLLQGKGLEVYHVVNGKEVIKLINNKDAGFFDAILMDISMPVMDGLEATRVIREMNRMDTKVIPILALSANASEDDIKQSAMAGMNGYLTKPIDTEKMFSSLCYWIKKLEESW